MKRKAILRIWDLLILPWLHDTKAGLAVIELICPTAETKARYGRMERSGDC